MAAEGSGTNRPVASAAIPRESRLSDSISCILRIGEALLLGFFKTLWKRLAAGSCPHLASLEHFGRDNLQGEQANGEEEPDAAQVYSLQEHMFRVLQELRRNPDITRMAKNVVSENPLHSLAEVSEEMFSTGINWGRIVVFFYFTFEVGRQFACRAFEDVKAWAMNFLRDRLALWIDQQGGWRLEETTVHADVLLKLFGAASSQEVQQGADTLCQAKPKLKKKNALLNFFPS